MVAMHTHLRITDKFGRSRYQWLRHGRDGTEQTLLEMARLVRHDLGLDGGAFDEGLSLHAQKILMAARVPGHDDRRAIEAIFYYVRNKIIYRRDAAGGQDDIADAREPIRLGYGDCDDLTVLLATLLGLAGYTSRFVVARFDGEKKARTRPGVRTLPRAPLAASDEATGFQHVYLEVEQPDGSGWLPLDPTNDKALPGWEPRSVERRTFQVFGEHEAAHLDGLKSVFKKVGKGLKKVGKIAAPIAAGFIPGAGQFASAGVSAGFDALDVRKANKQQAAAEQQAAASGSRDGGNGGSTRDPGGAPAISQQTTQQTILIAAAIVGGIFLLK